MVKRDTDAVGVISEMDLALQSDDAWCSGFRN